MNYGTCRDEKVNRTTQINKKILTSCDLLLTLLQNNGNEREVRHETFLIILYKTKIQIQTGNKNNT